MALSKEELFTGIRLARPLLILFICIAHMPGINGYDSDYDRFDQIGTLFSVYLKDFLARGAVPILTVISGYLAYSSYKKRSYRVFIGDKFKRLLWPFIVWNLIVLVAGFAAYRWFNINIAGVPSIDSVKSAIFAVVGIYRLPINAPTYFLRDLFMIMLITPFIHLACQRLDRFIALFLAYLLIFWQSPGLSFSLFGVIIPLTFRMDMVLFFALGYLLSVRRHSCPKVTGYTGVTFAILMGAFGLLFSMAVSGLNPSAPEFVQWRMLLGALFVCVAPALILGLVKIKQTVLGQVLWRLSPYSFTLFLSHTISAHVFMIIVRSKLGWLVSERSVIIEQVFYALLYLTFVSIGAVVILKVWRRLLSVWNSKRSHQSEKVA